MAAFPKQLTKERVDETKAAVEANDKYQAAFDAYTKEKASKSYEENKATLEELKRLIGAVQSSFVLLAPETGQANSRSPEVKKFYDEATSFLEAANLKLDAEVRENNAKQAAPPLSPKPSTNSPAPSGTSAHDPVTLEKINKVLNTLMAGMECLKNKSSAAPAPSASPPPTKGGAYNKSRKNKAKKTKSVKKSTRRR